MDAVVCEAEEAAAPADTLDVETLTGNWPKWISRRLKREVTDTGQEILVQKRNERGRPMIYYSVSRAGRVTRWLRTDWGPSGSTLHPPHPTGAGLYMAERMRSPYGTAAFLVANGDRPLKPRVQP